jgi:hypothetical protein
LTDLPVTREGVVYVLTNEAMPNMIKIGRTSDERVEKRVAELNRATGVPLPFRVAVARTVHDAIQVEAALHTAFAPDRVNPAREFFAIDAYRAVAIINAFPGRDMTPETERAVERAVEQEQPGSLAAAQSYGRKQRPPLNYLEMGIPIGSDLIHATGEIATVAEPKKVNFRGEVISLTRAQRIVSGAEHDVQPGRFWKFNNRLLYDIYEETYPRIVDS